MGGLLPFEKPTQVFDPPVAAVAAGVARVGLSLSRRLFAPSPRRRATVYTSGVPGPSHVYDGIAYLSLDFSRGPPAPSSVIRSGYRIPAC